MVHDDREEITFEAKCLAIGTARMEHEVEVAHGFMLPSFLFYDACVVGFLSLSFGLALWSVEEPSNLYKPYPSLPLPLPLPLPLNLTRSVEEPSWMLWTCAYYFRLIYSILSFPFLIFLIPIVGPSLHHAKPTAYDKQGMLVPKLTTAQASPHRSPSP